MKTQQFRPAVNNGQITQRRARPVASAVRAASHKSSHSTKHQRKQASAQQRSSRVLWTMMFIGIMLTAGFLLGLRAQINTHSLNQAEENLKTELDRAASHQKYLEVDQRRAMNLRESELVSKEAGLLPLRFDRRGEYKIVPARFSQPLRNSQIEADEEHSSAVIPKTTKPHLVQSANSQPAKAEKLNSLKGKKDKNQKLAASAKAGKQTSRKPVAGKQTGKLTATKVAAKPVFQKPARLGASPNSKGNKQDSVRRDSVRQRPDVRMAAGR